MKVLYLLVLLTYFSSCSNENCPDEDMGIEFNMFIRVISETGENLLDSSDFNLDGLKIIDVETQFPSNVGEIIETEEGEQLIVYSPINQRKLIFKYNGEIVGSFEIVDVVQPIENCILKTKSYTIFSEDELICKCNIDDVFTIRLMI